MSEVLHFKQEITKEDYDKALSKGACALFNERITLGYACINTKTSEENGKYYLEFDRGNDHAFLC